MADISIESCSVLDEMARIWLTGSGIVGVGEWQWEGMQLKQTQKRICRGHWDVQDELQVMTLMQVGGLDLEKVRGVVEQQLVSVSFGFQDSGIKKVS